MRHIEDGFTGLTRTAERLGLMVRPGVSRSLGLAVVQELSPEQHNTQLMNSVYTKERFNDAAFPAGTVLWFRDPVLGLKKATQVNDVAAMRDSCFFQQNSSETWYVNGRVRFFCKVMRTYRGVEVVSESLLRAVRTERVRSWVLVSHFGFSSPIPKTQMQQVCNTSWLVVWLCFKPW